MNIELSINSTLALKTIACCAKLINVDTLLSIFQGVSMKLPSLFFILLLISGCSNTNHSILTDAKTSVEQRERGLPEHLKTGNVEKSDVKKGIKHARNNAFLAAISALFDW